MNVALLLFLLNSNSCDSQVKVFNILLKWLKQIRLLQLLWYIMFFQVYIYILLLLFASQDHLKYTRAAPDFIHYNLLKIYQIYQLAQCNRFKLTPTCTNNLGFSCLYILMLQFIVKQVIVLHSYTIKMQTLRVSFEFVDVGRQD